MDITPYVERLRQDLLAAAEAGGPEARYAAERLSFAIDPSARLALMEAISQAAAEITAEMPSGGVDVRLAGRELEFVVEAPPNAPAAAAPTGPPGPTEDTDDGNLARITLRLPESVKNRAEELASRSGTSLNTWLVGILRAATSQGAINVDIDLTSLPFGRDTRSPRRMTGWI